MARGKLFLFCRNALTFTKSLSFSSQEVTILCKESCPLLIPRDCTLLVSTKNKDLWPVLIFVACTEYSFSMVSESDLCRSPSIMDFQFETCRRLLFFVLTKISRPLEMRLVNQGKDERVDTMHE